MLELLKLSVSKHAILETDLPDGLPPVRANAAQLRQIVMNLVINASEAVTSRDGYVRVATRRARPDAPGAAFENLADGNYVAIEVSDTGSGMSDENRARMFDAFFTTKSGGHGLGLAVVQGIVRSLGGAIDVVTELGTGTRVKVLLPCIAAAPEVIQDSARRFSEPAGSGRRPKVLVVDDEQPLRQVIVKILRKRGCEVVEAGDGSAAIQALRANSGKIDVVLLDMTLPGAPSNDVVDEASHWPDVKVVLTSAYSREMLAPSLASPQVQGFIRKPYELDDLVQALFDACSSGTSGAGGSVPELTE
jgi:CheY-like chemotaxis protein